MGQGHNQGAHVKISLHQWELQSHLQEKESWVREDTFPSPSTGQKPAGPLSGLVGESILLQRLAEGLNLGSLTDPNSRLKQATEVSEDTETQAHSTAGPFNGHKVAPAALGSGSTSKFCYTSYHLGTMEFD